jgi:hypothetical protein
LAPQASASSAFTSLVEVGANTSLPNMTTATKSPDEPSASMTPKLSINAEEVREIVELEHALTFREALSLYPKAIAWSFYFSLGVIMLGKTRSPTSKLFLTIEQHSILSFSATCTQYLLSKKTSATLSGTGTSSPPHGRRDSEWVTQLAKLSARWPQVILWNGTGAKEHSMHALSLSRAWSSFDSSRAHFQFFSLESFLLD